jgi:hypothetical protein
MTPRPVCRVAARALVSAGEESSEGVKTKIKKPTKCKYNKESSRFSSFVSENRGRFFVWSGVAHFYALRSPLRHSSASQSQVTATLGVYL